MTILLLLLLVLTCATVQWRHHAGVLRINKCTRVGIPPIFRSLFRWKDYSHHVGNHLQLGSYDNIGCISDLNSKWNTNSNEQCRYSKRIVHTRKVKAERFANVRFWTHPVNDMYRRIYKTTRVSLFAKGLSSLIEKVFSFVVALLFGFEWHSGDLEPVGAIFNLLS